MEWGLTLFIWCPAFLLAFLVQVVVKDRSEDLRVWALLPGVKGHEYSVEGMGQGGVWAGGEDPRFKGMGLRVIGGCINHDYKYIYTGSMPVHFGVVHVYIVKVQALPCVGYNLKTIRVVNKVLMVCD